jgi:hypothetical protein
VVLAIEWGLRHHRSKGTGHGRGADLQRSEAYGFPVSIFRCHEQGGCGNFEGLSSSCSVMVGDPHRRPPAGTAALLLDCVVVSLVVGDETTQKPVKCKNRMKCCKSNTAVAFMGSGHVKKGMPSKTSHGLKSNAIEKNRRPGRRSKVFAPAFLYQSYVGVVGVSRATRTIAYGGRRTLLYLMSRMWRRLRCLCRCCSCSCCPWLVDIPLCYIPVFAVRHRTIDSHFTRRINLDLIRWWSLTPRFHLSFLCPSFCSCFFILPLHIEWVVPYLKISPCVGA